MSRSPLPPGAGAALALAVLSGCGTKALDVEALTLGCEGVDLNDPPASTVEAEDRGDEVDVYRDAVFLAADLQFDPQFIQGPDRVEVHERWVGDGEGIETCLRPTVRFTDPPGGLAVVWYLEGEGVAFDNVIIEN